MTLHFIKKEKPFLYIKRLLPITRETGKPTIVLRKFVKVLYESQWLHPYYQSQICPLYSSKPTNFMVLTSLIKIVKAL